MKKLSLILILLLAVVGIGYWFWSLAAIHPLTTSAVELSVLQSGVQVKAPGSDKWQDVTAEMRIEQGWSIKTNESGLAVVRFYHQGETRLDRNSEMVITQAISDPKQKVEVTLNAGRVWSRVLRLLDIDSSYKVRTSEVVAMVRGTAFGVEKNSSGTIAVTVGESAVTVAPLSKPYGPAKAVGEGTVNVFSTAGASVSERSLTDEDRSGGWYVSNDMADQAFVKNEIERRTNELKQLDGPRPDSPLNGIASLSERVHLALANDTTKNVLLEQYLSRRLYHLIELVQAGKTGLASQEYTRIENDIQAQLDSKDKNANTDYIRSAVLRIAFLMDQANPDDALYPFKQRTERLFESLSSDSELSHFYSRMISFDSRLEEAVRLIDKKSFNDAQTTLDGVKSGIENVRRDSTSLLPTLTDEYRSAFEGKMSALEVRQRALQTKLDAVMHPIAQPNVTSTLMIPEGASTSTDTGLDQSFVSLIVTASQNKIDIGQRVKLTVKGKQKDGTEKDITAFAMFTSMQYAGKLNGPSYIGTGIGKDEIKAQYQSLEANVTVEVKGEVKLKDLVISSSSGVNLKSGQTTRLTATARYNNGVTKNVTNQTAFMIVSGNGSIQGTSFVNGSGMAGDTAIAGTYRDGELTAIGSLIIKSTE